MQIPRYLKTLLERWLGKGKILILYGARQVGKTTLVRSILEEQGCPEGYFNCEVIQVRQALEQQDPVALRDFLGDQKIVVLDEAQRVRNIGLTLKLLADTYPEMQIIATGSSSFELAQEITEPLTGRSLSFTLYPLSLAELAEVHGRAGVDAQLERYLRFGLYPEIALAPEPDARVLLDALASNYLYKDILEFEHLKRSDLLLKLLQLLALQIGSEVSTHELAVTLQTTRPTILRYLDLLEKAFVIVQLMPLSRNQRTAIAKKRKIYFMDPGIRNSLIGRYQPLAVRDDRGALWENLLIIERLKHRAYSGMYGNTFFWRTYAQQEVDFVEEYDGVMHGYEIKWTGRASYTAPSDYLKAYPSATVRLIDRASYWDFVDPKQAG